jgi:hypothetical protein
LTAGCRGITPTSYPSSCPNLLASDSRVARADDAREPNGCGPDTTVTARDVGSYCDDGTVPKNAPKKKLIEHRDPTPGTVKQLYGTAFRCAKPACREPLYRVNSDTDKTLLNSRVAHIHARSEGGPRWNHARTEEDNRSPDNLLLLCIPHASEIDDTPDDFPVPTLREWKLAQLDEHQRLQRGWDITDEQAAEIARFSFTLEDVVDAISERLPFSSRQRSRTEALDLVERRLRAARMERLSSVTPDRVEQVLQWMRDLPDPVVQAPLGQLRILIAPMGAGKTEQAARWLEEGVQHARDDDAVAIPVWLEAREAKGGLEEAVRGRLGQDPKAVCRVVLNDLDRVDPVDAERLVREAREMVSVWPKVAILATAQPGVAVDRSVSLDVAPWTVERGAQLMKVASVAELPWWQWNAETIELLRRPLTALALATRFASGEGTDVPRLQLLHDLPKTIIQARRPNSSSPEVWHALGRLAVRILQGRGPVPATFVGDESQVWQLTDTRLVAEHGGMLSFALPVFEQHFGAQAITSGTFEIEEAASRASFPFWRYAIAFAIATCPEARERERLLCRVARTNPAALSWVLDEIEPESMRRSASLSSYGTSPSAVRNAGEGDSRSAQTDLTIASALWLRESLEALLAGYGPLANVLAHHHEGQLVQWGAHLASGYMTLAEHWQQTTPTVVPLPDFTHLTDLRPVGWRSSRMFSAPTGDYGRWHWARNKILETLTDAIQRRALATSAGTRITHERLWILASFAISDAGVQLGRCAIPLTALRMKVAEMMERVNTSVSSTWQRGGYTFKSPDIIWLNEQLATLEGEELQRPWPLPDQPPGRRWRWQGYSRELAVSTTSEILTEAIAGYRDLVETNLPAFGSALGLYSLLPVRIEGTISYPQNPDDHPTGLNFAWVPDPSLDPHAAAPVELRAETEPGSWPYWHKPRGPRPESRTAYHIPMLEDGVTPLGGPRPSTNFAYEWLARDLRALGWLKHPITFHD